MPALSTVLGLAALASTLVRAAPIDARGPPRHWATGYLEDYDAYHLRYLALGCQNKHNTTFFDDCCHPLLATQSLSDRPDYCTPNATAIASASSYIASTSLYGPPTTTATVTGADATTTCTTDEATTTPATTPAAAATTPTTTKAAPTTTTDTPKAVYAEPTTTKTTTTQAYVAPTTQAAATTTKASSSGGGSGTQTGGYATYFYQGGAAGACGNYHSDSDYIIAIDSAWWPDMGSSVSQYCGRWITVQNTNNGKTVTAQVADVCPSCVNGNSLDLSVGAFTAIASTGDGMVPINWWWA